MDISCGGIAFYGQYGLENGETLEIVIPITANPLVLRCEILRQQTLRNNRAFYAAKFVDMCNDEETLLREAVFRVQLEDDQANIRTEVWEGQSCQKNDSACAGRGTLLWAFAGSVPDGRGR